MTARLEAHRRQLTSYRMPAEWERHLATYLVWPHNLDTWPGKFELIPPVFAQMAAVLAHFEPVRILLRDIDQMAEVRELIGRAPTFADQPLRMDRLEFLPIPTNDSWIRDYGPIFLNRFSLVASGPAQIAADWRFNSWGEKYGPYEQDDIVPRRLAEHYAFAVIEPEIVLEGGSVEVNGAGSLLTTESCLLNKNRNPSFSRPQLEEYLRTYFGVEQILWLGDGIAGDDTDGHIDDLARFTDRCTIVTVVEDDPRDANYRPLQDNLKRLRAMRDRGGNRFVIETLPMPPPHCWNETRLPASYANFYVANDIVLMPAFGCPADDVARTTLARLFAPRQITTIPATDLVLGLGTIHCLTQQHPAVLTSNASA